MDNSNNRNHVLRAYSMPSTVVQVAKVVVIL